MSASDLFGAAWRKSRYSGQNGECVEVADNLPGVVAVRDSKHPAGPSLIFSHRDFSFFVKSLADGEFNAS
ncbi:MULTISPECIES: DUF397 domain-containing protein [unclassified Streptomyces]|uniref:DUF397 domain-containing protein n=1 Tax=unclassified Streptomyces TaxID=2593676 RepID=UPI002E2BF7AB|nr:DUF397 domain-containing protein [Streptomyces sp. NBC_00223]